MSAIHVKMVRYAFATEVKEGKLEEYLQFHDNIYPEVRTAKKQLL